MQLRTCQQQTKGSRHRILAYRNSTRKPLQPEARGLSMGLFLSLKPILLLIAGLFSVSPALAHAVLGVGRGWAKTQSKGEFAKWKKGGGSVGVQAGMLAMEVCGLDLTLRQNSPLRCKKHIYQTSCSCNVFRTCLSFWTEATLLMGGTQPGTGPSRDPRA